MIERRAQNELDYLNEKIERYQKHLSDPLWRGQREYVSKKLEGLILARSHIRKWMAPEPKKIKREVLRLCPKEPKRLVS